MKSAETGEEHAGEEGKREAPVSARRAELRPERHCIRQVADDLPPPPIRLQRLAEAQHEIRAVGQTGVVSGDDESQHPAERARVKPQNLDGTGRRMIGTTCRGIPLTQMLLKGR